MKFNEYFNTMLEWDEQADWADEWYGREVYDLIARFDNLNELEVAYTMEEIGNTIDAWYDENA